MTTGNKSRYYDPHLDAMMPYGAYGPYEQFFYDKKISFQDFARLCSEDNYGHGLTVEDLKSKGYEISD